MLSPKKEPVSANDLRIGRSSNLNSNSSSNRSPNRSPNFRSSNRRNSMNSYNFDNFNVSSFAPNTTPRQKQKKKVKHSEKSERSGDRSPDQGFQLNNGQLIDIMEKEQDAIVLKLSKEIVNLREEIKFLKSNNFNHSRSNSFSRSHSSSISSVGNNINTSNRNSISNPQNYFLNTDLADSHSRKRLDSTSTAHDSTDQDIAVPRTFDDNPSDVLKENEMLKAKIAELQKKLDSLGLVTGK